MELPSSAQLLQIALCVYGAGAVASLLSLRHERIANLIGFGCAIVAAAFGIGAALTALIAGPGEGRASL